jgi:hypothetical protein
MQSNIALFGLNQLYDAVAREQEVAHIADMRNLSDLAFVFLNATNGNREQAAELLEQSIDLLCESGVLQMVSLSPSPGSDSRRVVR